MKNRTIFVGLDVHKDSISICVLDNRGSSPRPGLTIPNTPRDVARVFRKLKSEGEVRAAGAQLRDAGVSLHVPAGVLKRSRIAGI